MPGWAALATIKFLKQEFDSKEQHSYDMNISQKAAKSCDQLLTAV